MSKTISSVDERLDLPFSDSVESVRLKHQQQAQQLLDAYNKGDPHAVEKFHRRVPDAASPDYKPSLLHARLLVASDNTIPRRLSLEKLKKESKDLLKQLKAAAPEALERLDPRLHTKAATLKLADAQYIIARENGLPSWAKLKHHIAAMSDAREHIERSPSSLSSSPSSPDAEYSTLHIRCGNDIEQALLSAGFKGDFLEISNPFPQGHVPHFDALEAFIQIRTTFLTQHYGSYVPEDRMQNTEAEIRNVEDVLRHAPERYERIVLWYEHDAFDQLSKAYVLAHLAELNLDNALVECIQINSFPGVKKFIGIGQLSGMPEAILTLWSQRQAISPAMIAYGARCWLAFTKDDPLELWRLTEEDTPFSDMQQALKRMLMELPWTGNGLSLTEYLSLDILAREGEMRPGAIFSLLMTESDPQPFLGDIMLLAILRPLWEAEHPAITVLEEFPDKNPMRQTLLSITDLGRSLLEKNTNLLTLQNRQPADDRHVGGVHISANKKNWHWNPILSKPVFE